VRRTSAVLAMGVAAFAFGATSYDNYGTLRQDGVYYFSDQPDEVITRLNNLRLDHNGKTFDTNVGYDCPPSLLGPSDCVASTDLWISVSSDYCGQYFDARVEFRDWGDSTRATLERIDHECERDSDDIRELQAIFEREIIEPLGGFGTRREARLAAGHGGETTLVYDERVNQSVSYEVNTSSSAVMEHLSTIGPVTPALPFSPPLRTGEQIVTLVMPSAVCAPTAVVDLLVREATPRGAEVVLLQARGCSAGSSDRALFQLEFERRVIAPLRAP
jgi:hypothetical protein